MKMAPASAENAARRCMSRSLILDMSRAGSRSRKESRIINRNR